MKTIYEYTNSSTINTHRTTPRSTSPGTYVLFHDSSYIRNPVYIMPTSNKDDITVVYKENKPLSNNYFRETGGTRNGW